MKKNSSAPSLAKNHRNFSGSGSHGPFQPPRKSVTAIELIVITFANSPRKKSPNFMLEYSVWKPATSSASASGRSKGARLVSANAVIMKVMNATGCANTNQRGIGSGPRCQKPCCAATMSTIESEPASSSTPIVESPIASSYEIICAAERRPPSRAYLLFEDQPASVIEYTPRLDIARNSSSPTLMSVPRKLGETGTTESVTS